MIKKLILIIPLLFCALCYSCKDNSPIQKVVDDYRAGIISEDSLIKYVSDGVRVMETFDWASRHQYKDNMASWILGRAYKLGLGVDRDPVKSKAYYISACKAGNGNAMSGLAHLYEAYPDQENLDSAFYWYEEATKHGYPDAYFYLSQVEIKRNEQKNFPIDTIKVLEYLEKGIKQSSLQCITHMASIYFYGYGSIESDKSKAYNLLTLLPKDKLNAVSNYLLGQMYELGEGTNQSFNKALSYYAQSAEQGNTDAICKLGNFHQLGRGVERNDSLAFCYYNKAANEGNAWGQRCVAICYYDGIGTKQDRGVANYWYKTAARGGDIEAIEYCDYNKIEYH